MKNMRSADQFLRILAGVLLLEWGYFWSSGTPKWLAMATALVLLLTGVLRFCPLYRLLGLSTLSDSNLALGKVGRLLGVAALSIVFVGGSYASHFFSKKWFLEDFNAMNHFYKQTLFLTGKNERTAANTNFDQWRTAFIGFSQKYAQYRPYALRGDMQLDADLRAVELIQMQVEPIVRLGDLHQAHLDLEKVRPVFQEMFKRNGFSLLAVALVDFHDTMEILLDAATAGDAAKIHETYPIASDKLKAVEAEANDGEIQAIRKDLDALMELTKSQKKNDLKTGADQLKTSFVRVYLKRG